MNYIVFGAGMMGSALAYDLAQEEDTERVTLADADVSRARSASDKIGSPKVRAV